MSFKVLRYDDSLFLENGGSLNKTEYLLDKTTYGSFEFRLNLDPSNGWSVPFVTGHKYKIHWGETGLDFEQMQVTLSEEWRDTDKSIYLVHNWTDIRAAIDVNVNRGSGYEKMPNLTIAANEADHQLGQNIIYNETAIRETHLVITAKNTTDNPYA